jgi:uncharacterized membrane protein YkvA (DUF1232 family)
MRFARASVWNEDERLARDEATVRSGFWSKFGRLAARIPLAEELLTAYYCALDRRTPTQVRAALFGALAYFVLPLDGLPDVLPVLGLTDDAAVLAGVLKLVWNHIEPAHRFAAREALTLLTGAR